MTSLTLDQRDLNSKIRAAESALRQAESFAKKQEHDLAVSMDAKKVLKRRGAKAEEEYFDDWTHPSESKTADIISVLLAPMPGDKEGTKKALQRIWAPVRRLEAELAALKRQQSGEARSLSCETVPLSLEEIKRNLTELHQARSRSAFSPDARSPASPTSPPVLHAVSPFDAFDAIVSQLPATVSSSANSSDGSAKS